MAVKRLQKNLKALFIYQKYPGFFYKKNSAEAISHSTEPTKTFCHTNGQ
jgi:hypothetical protein